MNLNLCEKEILNNSQQEKKKRIYHIGSTEGLMDIGNLRKQQEDSVLITNHKEVDKIEMLMVADGMGGLRNGGFASNLVACQTFHWFQNLSHVDLYSNKNLITKFNEFVSKLDELVRLKCGGGGTTMVCAFILNDSILVSNIGDSRAYLYNENTFKQITIDHSITQKLFESGAILEKDHMRFHQKNNLITSHVGCNNKSLELDFFELDYKDIDKLFLFSDGVTDCVSDIKLQEIITNVTEETICDSIMSQTLTKDSYNYDLSLDSYYNEIVAGKDNASIVYKKIRGIN